jgi:hypothetical protein
MPVHGTFETYADAHRESRISYFIGISANVCPLMRDTWCCWARHDDFRNFGRAQCQLDSCRHRLADDAVGAGIFGVHWCLVDRLPGRVTLRRRIVVSIAVPDRCDRTPEIIMVFGIHYRNACIGRRDCSQGHEPRAIDQIQLFRRHDLTHDGFGALRSAPGDRQGVDGASPSR